MVCYSWRGLKDCPPTQFTSVMLSFQKVEDYVSLFEVFTIPVLLPNFCSYFMPQLKCPLFTVLSDTLVSLAPPYIFIAPTV